MLRWMMTAAMISLAYACSSAAPAAPPPRVASSRATSGASAAAPARPPQPPQAASPAVAGRIDRAALLPVLDAGLGRFLQGVQTKPFLVEGKFVGFEVLSLWPNDPRFQHSGIRLGDVVVRVNGQSIEHPEQALEVWNGLRVASALYIELLRNGRPRELRFAIVDR